MFHQSQEVYWKKSIKEGKLLRAISLERALIATMRDTPPK
jgi:hypothetical protein